MNALRTTGRACAIGIVLLAAAMAPSIVRRDGKWSHPGWHLDLTPTQ